MDAREGMRRLGLVAGALGAVTGLCVSYVQILGLLEQRARFKEFQSVLSSPVLQREIQFLNNRLAGNKDPDFSSHHHGQGWFDAVAAISGSTDGWKVEEGGVNKIYFERNEVKTIERADGEIVSKGNNPTLWPYLLLPVLGFCVPWGTLKALTWVASGFFPK